VKITNFLVGDVIYIHCHDKDSFLISRVNLNIFN
jgi:hypothetical protein